MWVIYSFITQTALELPGRILKAKTLIEKDTNILKPDHHYQLLSKIVRLFIIQN